jgi:hypothetical protein
MLTKQAIEEFQQLYRKHYGRDISFDAAADQAARLLRLYELTFRGDVPPPEPRRKNEARQ